MRGAQQHAGVPAAPAAELRRAVQPIVSSAGQIASAGRQATLRRRYSIDGYPLFTDPHGVPAIAPPWGTLNAIDLVNGDIRVEGPAG